MKKIMFFIAAMLITSVVFAQTIRDEHIAFDKDNSYFGVVLDVSGYEEEVVEDALASRFEQVTKKSSKSGKFRIYKGQAFREFGPLNYDIYTQIVRVGKKKDNRVAVQLLVSKGNMNFVSPSTDSDVIDGMRSFLKGFVDYLQEYDTSLKAVAQDKVISKLEKDAKSLVSDKEKLQKQLADKENEIIKKQEEIQKAKELLQTLRP